MNETISLLKFSVNNSSNKEKIIHLLSVKWPLSTKEIYEQLKKEYGVESSYQAVHKTIFELEEQNMIEKVEKDWKIKNEWLQKGGQFFNNALEKYSGTINRYEIPVNFDGTLAFEFDSFTDLCVRTAELLESKILAKNSDAYFICVMEYGWWTFKFRFQDLYILFTTLLKCPNSKNIIRKDTPFGRWIREQYLVVKGVCAPIGTNVDIEEDVFVQGDHIIEVKIPEEGKKIIEKYWNKWASINDTLMDFGLKEEPKIHTTVKITKNPQLATFMRKELEKYFDD